MSTTSAAIDLLGSTAKMAGEEHHTPRAQPFNRLTSSGDIGDATGGVQASYMILESSKSTFDTMAVVVS